MPPRDHAANGSVSWVTPLFSHDTISSQKCNVIFLDNVVSFFYNSIKRSFNRYIQSGGFPMKKTYQIEVDCANCAAKMEQAAAKTPGISSVTVNFMAQKMVVEFAEGADIAAVMNAVAKNCHKVSRDCEIYL
jgi:copper chaperone CopZ